MNPLLVRLVSSCRLPALLAALAAAVCVPSSLALSADGWASQNGGTTGGTGGVVVTATTAASFRSYAEDTTTRIIQVSGTLDLGTTVVAIRSNKTIVGLGTTAHLKGNLRVSSPHRNIIIKNLTISNNAGVAHGDGLTIYDGGTNVWVDHCTFIDCADGMLDITRGSDFVTVSWCRFYYTRDNGHNFANLVGGADTDEPYDTGKLNVTFHHNWYGSLVNARTPRVRFGKVHVYNNFFNSPGNGSYIAAAISSQILVQNNSFEEGKNAWLYFDNTPRGKIWATGNQFVNIAVPAGGTEAVFSPPYPYVLDSAADVKALVTAGAGVNGDSSSGSSIFDTFEDGNANGWAADGGTWSVATSTTKVYRAANDSVTAVRSTLSATAGWTDQIVEADVKLNSSTGTNRFFGLVARLASSGDYYYFILRTNNTIELKKLVGGTSTTLASGTFTVAAGVPYALKLEAIGTSLKAYINGQLKLQATDTQFASGKAGLVTYYTSVDFDDVYADPVPNNPILVADDFQDGKANGWTPNAASTWSVVTDGSLVYRQTNRTSAETTLSVTGDPSWTDQIIELDAKAIGFDGTDRWIGVLARYTDANNYYYITFRSSNSLQLKKMVAGTFTTLASTPLTLTVGTWYEIKLKAIGSSLKVYVNGELKLEAVDSSLTSGRPGLIMFKAEASYDDVVVTKP